MCLAVSHLDMAGRSADGVRDACMRLSCVDRHSHAWD